jgi:uncharacterized RDD family membrane protein YckC
MAIGPTIDTMSAVEQSLGGVGESRASESGADAPHGSQATPASEERFVGAVTRVVSWWFDWAVVNLVAILVGLGAELVLSIFPVTKSVKTPLEVTAGSVYLLWTAIYFVAFWSTTGQTPGARVMQIRQVRANRQRVKPARAFVRWVGMNLAILPFCAGYVPVLFRRRPFPDWLAKTLVLDATQLSLAQVLAARHRAARGGAGQPSPAVSPELESSPSASADGGE